MSDFNVRNVTGLVLEGGKSLTASNTTPQGLKVTDKVALPGLRFRTRVEGRTLWAFAPFKSIVGIYGSAEGVPVADPTITFDAAGLEGLFLVGGRFLKVMKSEAVTGFDGADALRLVIQTDSGTNEGVTVALSQVIAFLGELRTDYERENEAEDDKAKDSQRFIATYGTDSVTWGAAMAKQTTYSKATKLTTTNCAACQRPLPSKGYGLPVYIAGVGIVHRTDVRCNPFSKAGLIAHNQRARQAV